MGDFDHRLIIRPTSASGVDAHPPISPSNCAEARNILEKNGYAPDKRLVVTVPTRLGCPDAVMFIRG
jgi:hypothetical protein